MMFTKLINIQEVPNLSIECPMQMSIQDKFLLDIFQVSVGFRTISKETSFPVGQSYITKIVTQTNVTQTGF